MKVDFDDILFMFVILFLLVLLTGCTDAPLTPSRAGSYPLCTKPDVNGIIWCGMP